MKRVSKLFLFPLVIIYFSSLFVLGQNRVVYKKKTKFPVLESIKKKRDKAAKEAQNITDIIIKKNKEIEKKEKERRKALSSDMRGVFPPTSLEEFNRVFHFPPVAQFYTSTCWSFSATSYYESEIYRLHKRKVKLSEMWTVYFELIEKAVRFINERGFSEFSGGAESNSINRIWKKYGIVPAKAYTGIINKDGRHDHVPMMSELTSYLNYVKENNLWNEKENIAHIKLILDKYMGTPPKTFSYNGKEYNPKNFFNEIVNLNMDDYFSVMSTKYFPFYTKQEFTVPDNWWHSKDYINLPLNIWYDIIRRSIKKGYSLVIGGDVSEPGKLGISDISFIPTFDIPARYINQDSREFRIYNKTTQDDHGIHLVGYKRKIGNDWFLIKDSGRSGRLGKFKGYYFFRDDFVKLKMLTFTVHKDMLKNILPKIK